MLDTLIWDRIFNVEHVNYLIFILASYIIRSIDLLKYRNVRTWFLCLQIPPPLEVPLQFIGKDPEANTKNLQWEDDGMLNQTLDIF